MPLKKSKYELGKKVSVNVIKIDCPKTCDILFLNNRIYVNANRQQMFCANMRLMSIPELIYIYLAYI